MELLCQQIDFDRATQSAAAEARTFANDAARFLPYRHLLPTSTLEHAKPLPADSHYPLDLSVSKNESFSLLLSPCDSSASSEDCDFSGGGATNCVPRKDACFNNDKSSNKKNSSANDNMLISDLNGCESYDFINADDAEQTCPLNLSLRDAETIVEDSITIIPRSIDSDILLQSTFSSPFAANQPRRCSFPSTSHYYYFALTTTPLPLAPTQTHLPKPTDRTFKNGSKTNKKHQNSNAASLNFTTTNVADNQKASETVTNDACAVPESAFAPVPYSQTHECFLAATSSSPHRRLTGSSVNLAAPPKKIDRAQQIRRQSLPLNENALRADGHKFINNASLNINNQPKKPVSFLPISSHALPSGGSRSSSEQSKDCLKNGFSIRLSSSHEPQTLSECPPETAAVDCDDSFNNNVQTPTTSADSERTAVDLSIPLVSSQLLQSSSKPPLVPSIKIKIPNPFYRSGGGGSIADAAAASENAIRSAARKQTAKELRKDALRQKEKEAIKLKRKEVKEKKEARRVKRLLKAKHSLISSDSKRSKTKLLKSNAAVLLQHKNDTALPLAANVWACSDQPPMLNNSYSMYDRDADERAAQVNVDVDVPVKAVAEKLPSKRISPEDLWCTLPPAVPAPNYPHQPLYHSTALDAVSESSQSLNKSHKKIRKRNRGKQPHLQSVHSRTSSNTTGDSDDSRSRSKFVWDDEKQKIIFMKQKKKTRTNFSRCGRGGKAGKTRHAKRRRRRCEMMQVLPALCDVSDIEIDDDCELPYEECFLETIILSPVELPAAADNIADDAETAAPAENAVTEFSNATAVAPPLPSPDLQQPIVAETVGDEKQSPVSLN